MGASVAVPPFDVVIDGQGYMLYDAEKEKALFGNTSTFIPRSNTQGNYGDNQQDAFLTVTQNDWSLGEQQKYYRGNDEDKSRRFWRGKNVDITVPGEVSIRPNTRSVTPAAAPVTAGPVSAGLIYFATSTTLYSLDYDGTITSIGAHGLGAAPSRFGLVGDPSNRYLSTTSGGTVGVRRETGGAFSTWSATPSDSLAFLNNALYGYRNDTGVLQRYSTGGVATTVFTWQDATGGGAGVPSKIMAFGGKLLILRYRTAGPRGAELWLYDGNAPAKIAEFPSNFICYEMEILDNTVYVSGHFRSYKSSSLRHARPAIYFYRDGTQGVLWQAETSAYDGGNDMSPPLCVYDGGLVFHEQAAWASGATTRVCRYDPTTGSISTLFEPNSTGGNDIMAAAATFFMFNLYGTTTAYVFPHNSDNASSAEIDSSLIDFDSSLPKLIRGIRTEFDKTSTGTLDIAYRFDDLDSTYTTLQTNATSGTEYPIAAPSEGTTYRKVSVRCTLNRGATTTSQVKLKRVAVRGMPVYPAYKKRTYVLYLGGRDGESPVKLRDGTFHTLDGKDMATNLQTAAGRTSPFIIQDHLGSFTGRIDEGGLELVEVKPEVWIARIRVREV